MMPAILILWFAWALSAMTDDDQLNTGGYLAETSDRSNRSSNASYDCVCDCRCRRIFYRHQLGHDGDTDAIVNRLGVSFGRRLDPGDPIVLATCGSVLAGAIFGDHCSPISDTTVLSSRASGCDHVAHVRTQMPYALVAGAVSLVVGTIPAWLGISPWISLVVGAVALGLIIRLFGRPVKRSS